MAEQKHKGDGHDHGAPEMKEALQRKYLELQMLSHQIKELQQQIQNIDAQLAELESTSSSIQELSKTKESTEMFVPVNSGVFARTELKDSRKLLVNVGAGVAVMKPASDIREMIDSQMGELSSYRDQAAVQLQKLIEHARDIEKELKKLV